MIIGARKLKNSINKLNPNMEFYLKDIRINGIHKGASGFIVNPANGNVVYVTTEEPCLSNLHYMYRYADSIKDYTGYRNRWADTLEQLVLNIHKLLIDDKHKKDFKF